MIVYFADRKMNILGKASTGLPKGFIINNDWKSEDAESGVATLEFELLYDSRDAAKADKMILPGNYLLRDNNSRGEFYTIIDSENDTEDRVASIYAEDAGLDLLNEIVGEYEATEAHPISFYVDMFANDSGFEIGLNEISDRSRKLSWDGEATATERLLSVATQFDAEISFSFTVDGMKVTHKYVDIYKQRGQDNGVELRRGIEVGRIRIKRSVADVATALKVTGGTPEGAEKPITLAGYSYDDGDIYVSGSALCSRSALKKWSRYLCETGTGTGNIIKTFSYDTTSQSELCNRAVADLKKRIDMAVNYEVELLKLPNNLGAGDTVNIVDREGDLYLSARVLTLKVSVANRTQSATLGDYLMSKSASIE